jgi:hypothetical protein
MKMALRWDGSFRSLCNMGALRSPIPPRGDTSFPHTPLSWNECGFTRSHGTSVDSLDFCGDILVETQENLKTTTKRT